jgi:hypothetical protein
MMRTLADQLGKARGMMVRFGERRTLAQGTDTGSVPIRNRLNNHSESFPCEANRR